MYTIEYPGVNVYKCTIYSIQGLKCTSYTIKGLGVHLHVSAHKNKSLRS